MIRLLLGLAISGLMVPAAAANEFAVAAARAQPRLVKIYGGSIGRSPGYATGLVVSHDGLILTSYGAHLAANSLRVTLADGQQHQAQLLRSDATLQAALLKIDAVTPDHFDLQETPPNLERGDWILSLSNAFKVAEGPEALSVNLGVFTTRTRLDARRGTQDFPYAGDVLLYDAITSNPGAAGGAVVDADGRLLGMIGRVIEGKHSGTRLNYAFPVATLAQWVLHPEKAKEEAMVDPAATTEKRGELGIRLFALSGRNGPAFVDRLIAGSPAAEAGLRTDDLILSLNGQAIRTADEFRQALLRIQHRDQVRIEVRRKQQVLTFSLIATEKMP